MGLRGSNAVRNAKKKNENRSNRKKGGGAFEFNLDWGLKTGESAETVVRFRGLFPEEIDIDEYLGSDDKVSFKGLDEDDLMEMATDLGACVWEDMTEDHLRSSIERRVDKEVEPAVFYRHFISRNSGRDKYQNCGDNSAINSAESYEFKTNCRFCHARQEGDDGVGMGQGRVCWTVYDMRYQHRTKGTGGDRDEYNDCTMEKKGRCVLCSRNRKIDDTPQEEMESDDLKDLFENSGYSPVRQIGNRVLNLPLSQEALVLALATEIRTTLCRCGGNLKVIGAECPHCGEEYDFDDLVEAGWNPEEPDPDKQLEVRCGECAEKDKPKPQLECDECDEPTSARLGDVPIRIKVIKGEKFSQWSFQVAGDVCPMELGDDEETDKILGARMPDLEEYTKEPTVEEQVKHLGLRSDPLDSDDLVDSPTISRGSKPKGKKGKKGGKGTKGKKEKKSGFMNRG